MMMWLEGRHLSLNRLVAPMYAGDPPIHYDTDPSLDAFSSSASPACRGSSVSYPWRSSRLVVGATGVQ